MTVSRTFQKLRGLPRRLRRHRRVMRAWRADDWPRLLSILGEPQQTEDTSDIVLRAVAYARLGQYPAAVQQFERVHPEMVSRFDQDTFFNGYANALRRLGRDEDAINVLRAAPLGRFPKEQREWAQGLIRTLSQRQTRALTQLPGLDGAWTHWWIEGDGSLLEIVPGECPLRVRDVVNENRDRMDKIEAFRAKLDLATRDFVHENHGHTLSRWNAWTHRS